MGAVNCPSLETEVTSTLTRPVVIRTKGLQDRNNLLLDGRTVENIGNFSLKSLQSLHRREDH